MEKAVPLVSIICPVYNKEKYLSKTIESVLNQTSHLWELILVDDGSTDGSPIISQNAEKKDERIRLFRRDDLAPTEKGANVCRNIGLDRSQGRFIVFLDADDVLLPFCIEQRHNVAEKEPEYGLYVFNVAYTMGFDKEPFAKLRPTQKELNRVAKAKDLRNYFLKKYLSFDLPWHTSGAMWKRETLLSMKGFDENFQRLQDPEIHTRALLDRNIRLNYQMGNTPYDVLHLKDEERVVWDLAQFHEKQINSIEAYIKKFVPLVKGTVGSAYLKYLKGYLIFAETLTYRYFRDNHIDRMTKQRLVKCKNELFKRQEVKEIMTVRFRISIAIYRLLCVLPFLSKLKISGGILLLMRRGI